MTTERDKLRETAPTELRNRIDLEDAAPVGVVLSGMPRLSGMPMPTDRYKLHDEVAAAILARFAGGSSGGGLDEMAVATARNHADAAITVIGKACADAIRRLNSPPDDNLANAHRFGVNDAARAVLILTGIDPYA